MYGEKMMAEMRAYEHAKAEKKCTYECTHDEDSDSDSGEDLKMASHSDIDGLRWGKTTYSKEPHVGCDEEGCEGQTCQYNALCHGCDCVLSKHVSIYCLERKGAEITLCSECFEDTKDAMKDEGGWSVDGEPFVRGHEQWDSESESEDDGCAVSDDSDDE